jgi:hypothetical protein
MVAPDMASRSGPRDVAWASVRLYTPSAELGDSGQRQANDGARELTTDPPITTASLFRARAVTTYRPRLQLCFHVAGRRVPDQVAFASLPGGPGRGEPRSVIATIRM